MHTSTTLLTVLSTLALVTPLARAEGDQPQRAPTAAKSERFISINYVTDRDDSNVRDGFAAEATHQIDGHAFAHAQLAYGHTDAQSLNELDDGEFLQLRAGIEMHTSGTNGRVFGGLDVGYRSEEITVQSLGGQLPMTFDTSAWIGVPRVGVEIGQRLRARFALEGVVAQREYGFDAGIGLSIGAGTEF